MSGFIQELPVQLSEEALEQVHRIRQLKGIDAAYGLRVGVLAAGGCGSGGMRYLLGFDKPKEGDDHYQLHGLPIYIEKKHTMYLIGLRIEWVTEGGVTGFTFVNPDANRKGK